MASDLLQMEIAAQHACNRAALQGQMEVARAAQHAWNRAALQCQVLRLVALALTALRALDRLVALDVTVAWGLPFATPQVVLTGMDATPHDGQI